MPVFTPGAPWLRGTATLANGSTTVTTDGVITLNEILEGDRLYVFDGAERLGPFEIVGGEGAVLELREPFTGSSGSYPIAIDRNPLSPASAKILRDVGRIMVTVEEVEFITGGLDDAVQAIEEIKQSVAEAESYADSASASLQAAQEITGGAYGIGTRPMELPRNTELASGAFAPHEPMSLWPIVPTGSRTLTPDDSGKIVWSAGHNITLPDSTAPGMSPGWRVWIKNTDGASSLTIDCGGAGDTIDGGASLSLAAGESVLIVMIADGEFGSL